MRCPQCGAEVEGGKFCGSCGTPVQTPAAAYQPQQVPYPMPMPPKKKSLTWLWITLGVVGVVLALLVGVLLLGDDDPAPGPGPSGKSGQVVGAASADAAVKSYLEARKAGDAAAAYAWLSPQARQAYTQADFADFYKDSKVSAFGKVEIKQSADPWYLIEVKEMTLGDHIYSGILYTVVKADGKYWLALDNPLNVQLDKAFDAKQYETALKVTDQMQQINAFSYSARYSRGWAQLEQKQYTQALATFDEAGKYAIAEDRSEVVRSIGIAYARQEKWDQAVPKLEEARQLAHAVGNYYDADWLRQLDNDLISTYEKAGKVAQALDMLEPIYKADPEVALGRAVAVRLERKPYKVENGMATYKLVLQGVSFALPQDWVISSETTGGDYWFARHPASPKTRNDLAVYFHGDYLGKTMDEAVAGMLKRYQEPIGAPKQDISIKQKQTITLGGKPGVAVQFSTGTVSILVQGGYQPWTEFHWVSTPETQAAVEKWLPTVQFTK